MSAQDELLSNQPPPSDPQWVLTIFGDSGNALYGSMTEAAAQDDLRVLNARTLAEQPRVVQEIGLAGRETEAQAPAAWPNLRVAMRQAREAGNDAVLQETIDDRRSHRLLVMDVDSTLIRQEVIDEIARAAGAYDEVSAITERAMNGELSFEASLRARVGALKNVPESIFMEVLNRIQVTEGAETLVRAIQKHGGKVAMISGGFIQVVEPLRARLGIDFAFANTLAVADGRLTGGLDGMIVDRAKKATLLEGLAREHGFSLDRVIAIGDGANDLDMLAHAGLGIAFNAKPSVQAQAPSCLNQPSLASVLYLLGHEHAEIGRL